MGAGVDLYLVRHPRVIGGDGRCYGRLDLPLASDPQVAAARLRGLLPAAVVADALVYSSPASRCRALAGCFSAAPLLDPRLLEMHFGSWEGCLWDAIDRPALDAWAAEPLSFVPPGGESPQAVRARALAWVAEMQASHAPAQPLLVFTHAGPIRMLLTHWMHIDPDGWPRVNIDFGSVSHVRLEGARAQVLALNQ